MLPTIGAASETNSKDAQASIQVYIRGENWRKLLERLEWSPLAVASGKSPEQIDSLRGGAVLELIIRGVLLVKDSTVRTPSASAAERNRFRATPVTLNHLLSGLVPNSNGPLTAGIFEKMDQNSKLKVFCRGLCSYVSPPMSVLEPAGILPPSKKQRQTTPRKRSRVATEELDEGASFLLSLGSKDDEDQAKNSHPPPQPFLTQLSGPLLIFVLTYCICCKKK